ncbi:DUF2752 domain-containing protein, partial [Sphingobacterium sp.]
GLTTALIALLRLEWREAWLANPLVYILVPVLIGLILRDFVAFWRKELVEE